jgi:hypothetical protein
VGETLEQRVNRLRWVRRSKLGRFGIGIGLYEQMLEAQDGVCAICRAVCSTGKSLAVDHDHGSGVVRGLLCLRCNLELGVYEAGRDKFEAYLAQYGAGNPVYNSTPEDARLDTMRRRGVTNTQAKLTEEQVTTIRARYEKGGITQRQLAKEFGVALFTIGKIVRRQAWQHVA